MNETSNQFNTAWEGIEKSWNDGQLAHAYLLQGAPHGAALRFAEKLLNLIFNNHPQVQTRAHPDILWIEPESKSRQIKISQIRPTKSDRRENIVERFSTTSFSGGWKAGVILCADRMTDQAANALLKTLEEPPARSLLLLVTNEPQSLLATISSRCQRIALSDADEEVCHSLRSLPHDSGASLAPLGSKHWKDPLLDILGELPPASIPEAGRFTGRLTGILNELKKEFEAEESERLPEDLSAKEAKDLLGARSTARLIESRTEILRTMLQWQRDILLLVLEQDEAALHFQDDLEPLKRQAMLCTRADALRRIAAVDEMARQFDRNLPAELVFSNFFTQLL